MKKQIIAAAVAVLLTAGAAGASEKWSTEDYAREAAFFGVLAADAAQTLHIARNPQEHREMNPILGDHPKGTEVAVYFAACAIAHAYMADHLEGGWRTSWQLFWFADEVYTVQFNRRSRTGSGGVATGIGLTMHY